MTQPPPPGPWGPQPQYPGNRPANSGGQPGPGSQGQWNPEPPQWPQPTSAPQKKDALKWILGAIALIAVIAVTAVVAVTFAGGNDTHSGNSGSTTTSGSKSDIASANDTAPISVITEDPSCAPWNPVNNIVADTQKDGSWDQRDPSIPASAWTADMRARYTSVANALRTAADQTIPLVKLTPHRVMRELYEQYIAYARLFVDRVPSYTQADNTTLAVATTTGSVISSVCNSISSGSAAARGPIVPAADSPSETASPGNPSNPEKFMGTADAQCSSWNRTVDELTTSPVFADWLKIDSAIPASRWTPQDKLANDAVKPVISRAIDAYEQLARSSTNPTAGDFGTLAVLYGRAFIQGLPTYTGADMNLYLVFLRAPGIISSACKTAGAY